MKIQAYLVLLIVLLSMACEEVGPTISPTIPKRKVLIEEFTGVGCSNCPEGATRLQSLKDIYGDNLVVLSIHAGVFAYPISESEYDFRTEEGDALETYLGPVLGYPSAVVNRNLFDGAGGLPVALTDWAAYIEEELEKESPVKPIDLSFTFDEVSRELNLTTKLVFLEKVDEPISLSIMLAENGVIDAQYDGLDLVLDYEHKHILRDMLTAFDGEAITETTGFGVEVSRNYTYTIPTEWKVEKMEIIAVLSQTGPELDVLQVEGIKLGQ